MVVVVAAVAVVVPWHSLSAQSTVISFRGQPVPVVVVRRHRTVSRMARLDWGVRPVVVHRRHRATSRTGMGTAFPASRPRPSCTIRPSCRI
uniref:Putative secreted protein n=1 Tax=Anopheles triannulatus TaxID=58253 RepID=A0A2M4B1B8_9DIPT